MITAAYNHTAARPVRALSRRAWQAARPGGGLAGWVATALGTLAIAGVSTLFLALPREDTVITLGLLVLSLFCVLRAPVAGVFITVGSTIVIDTFGSPYIQTYLSEMGFFANMSNLGLSKALLVSMFEVIVTTALGRVIVERLHTHQPITGGPLGLPVGAFTAMVLVGELNCLATGGDFKISLWEIRPLLYFSLLYFLAVNTIRKPEQIRTLLWVVVIGTIFRSLDGIGRYLMIPPDLRAKLETIIEHDDSLFLASYFGLVAGAILWRAHLPRRLLPLLLVGMPPIGLMMGLNGRRAVFLSLGLIAVVLVPFIWISLRSAMQRRYYAYALAALALLGLVYLGAFWNSRSAIGKPAQAVRSVFQPDERDYLSNLYRDQENANLRATIARSPIIGIGFGKPMVVVERMVNLQGMWALQLYMPHNNMLWLWERMGIIGFAAFWAMMGSILLLVSASVRLGVAQYGRLRRIEWDITHPRMRNAECGVRNENGNGGQATTEPSPTGRGKMNNAWESEARGQNLIRDRQPPAPNVIPHSALRTPQLGVVRRQLGVWAEFLVFAYLLLAALVTQASLAVVDQGLMSFRLAPYVGALVGSLAAIWCVYARQTAASLVAEGAQQAAGTKPELAPHHGAAPPPAPAGDPPQAKSQNPQSEEEPRVYRRRVRYLSGA